MNVSWVGVHGHDFLLQRLFIVAQVDGIAQRFAHLGVAVQPGNPALAFWWEDALWFNQNVTVDVVE